MRGPTAGARSVGLALLCGSILLSAAGQLGMKAGMIVLHGSGTEAIGTALSWTLGGLMAYACSMLLWLGVLARYPLSYAYPLLGLSYALVYAGATHWRLLMEPATPLRTAGTFLIIAGVALVSATREKAPAAPSPEGGE